MKKSMLLLYFSFLFVCDGNAQWELQNPLPVAGNLNDNQFYNDQIGWSVGSYGAIVKTSDGGITWNIQESGVNESLKKVCIVAEDTVWISGNNGCLLYTDNGGENWIQKSCGTSLDLSDITFLNSSDGWLVGHEDYDSWYNGNFEFIIKHTTNGGVTWDTQLYDTTYTLRGLCFINENMGWAVGEKWDIGGPPGSEGILLYSNDEGKNWEKHQDSNFISLGTGFKDIVFSDPSNGWIIGGTNIFRTSDGGTSWQIQLGGYYAFNKISFADSLNGLIAGSKHAGSASSIPIVFKTINGGNFWEEQEFWFPFSSFSGSCMISPDNSFIVGSRGRIAKTNDGGTTWDFFCETTTFIPLEDIHFIDSLHGWVIGNSSPPSCYASCLRTVDGGKNWEFLFNNIQLLINGVCFVDQNNGWIAGEGSVPDRGLIHHTTDGGYSWTIQYSDIGRRYGDIHFVDNQYGWAVGETGRVVHSNDGGESWNVQSTPTVETLFKVFFIDRNNGWIAGRSGIVLGTIDGGNNWVKQVTETNQYLYDIHFFDQYNGFVVGDSGSIFHTIDGGNTWQINNSGSQNRLWGVSTTSVDNAWAVGVDGEILYTINGGNTWDQDDSPVNGASYLGLCFTDENKGWAVGTSGIIIHIDNGTIVNIEEQNNHNKYSLATIHYPNPCTKEVTIRYFLEEPSKVMLRIFNSQGKQIDEIAEKQTQGINELKWDGGIYPSGIYYYRIESKNLIGSGKVIFIK
jgi:photosystem II stability/assembly factor-like uncharacterized protein